MKDIHMPPAALEAGARALHAQGDWSHIPWEELEDCDRDYYKAEARATFLAMVEAWPGVNTIMLPRMMQPGHFVPQDYIRLPLMENPDGK